LSSTSKRENASVLALAAVDARVTCALRGRVETGGVPDTSLPDLRGGDRGPCGMFPLTARSVWCVELIISLSWSSSFRPRLMSKTDGGSARSAFSFVTSEITSVTPSKAATPDSLSLSTPASIMSALRCLLVVSVVKLRGTYDRPIKRQLVSQVQSGAIDTAY
jgi:hypothetical protein